MSPGAELLERGLSGDSDPGRAPRLQPFVLAGCGTVGGALLGLVRRGQGSDEAVEAVLVRDPARVRQEPLPEGRVVTRAEALTVGGGSTVVELLGGIEPALGVARRTLEGGGTFITANKALVARHGVELAGLATRSGGRLAFEGAVGGGMPIVRLLRDLPPEAGVRRVSGILNGTSNFLLDRLAGGAGWDDALAEARALGYAEADPSRDLDGRDAEDKIRILGWLAFGTPPREVSVVRRGIFPDPVRLAREARAAGGVARLLARVERVRGRTLARVEPVLARPGSAWAEVRGADNRVEVETSRCGVLSVGGPGAGGDATATAVLLDLREAQRGGGYGEWFTPGACGGGTEVTPVKHNNTWVSAFAGGTQEERGRRSDGWEVPGERWHLSISTASPPEDRADPRQLLARALTRTGVEGGRLEAGEGRSRLHLAAVPAARVDLLHARLEALGLEPIILREAGAALLPPVGGGSVGE